jgi:hypothetical protein
MLLLLKRLAAGQSLRQMLQHDVLQGGRIHLKAQAQQAKA